METAIIMSFDLKTGEFKIEAEGFQGGSCLQATQPFEEALGIVGDRTYKPEAQAQPIRTCQQQQGRLRQ
jgi:hypothetical protein